MKEIINNIQKLNKIFDNRIRLGIMSILMVDDWVEFKRLKEMLKASDGNLASHLSTLEKQQFVEIRKQFVGRKPQTTYAVTDKGRAAFNDHLNALEAILKGRK